MESKFFVGQKVVATRDNHNGFFKKGQIFTILAIALSPCKCKRLIIDVGLGNKGHKYFACPKCKKRNMPVTNYEPANQFAPLDEKSAESEAFADTILKEMEEAVEAIEWLHK